MKGIVVKSIKGNVISADFKAVDPKTVLNGDCLEIFQETIKEIEQYDKITTKEWNMLIEYIQKLDQAFDEFQQEQDIFLSVIN